MSNMDVLSWLILRLGYASLYWYAVIGLLKNWENTKNLVGLLFPNFTALLASAMIIVMIVSPLCIVLGMYAQIAAFSLVIYNLLGTVTHYKLAALSTDITLSTAAVIQDKNALKQCKELAYIGNTTSAQKNIPLTAVALFIMIHGSGPLSIGNPFF